jgi:hypothetical protein
MAKFRKGGSSGNPNKFGDNTTSSKSTPSNSANQEIINQEKVDTLLSQAREDIDEDELKGSSDSSTPENFNSQELWHQAQIFDKATKQLESKIQKIETQQKDLETEKSQLQTKLSSLEQDRQNIDQEQKQIKERFVELIKNEEQVRKRELNAELGFIAQNQAVLQQFDHQVQEFRQELSHLYEIIATEKRKLAEEIAQKRKSLEQELEDERQKIEHQQKQITEDRKKVKFEQRKLQADKELFEEEKQFQDEKIEQLSAARVERLEVKIQILEGQLQEARQIREQFQTKLMQRAEADRRFGQRTPDEVLAELEASRRLNDELEQKLSERPTEEAANQLSDLLIQQEEWETQRSQLKMQMEEQKRKAAMNQIAVLELETLRSQKEALEICINRLQESLRELRKQEEDAIGESKNRSPFERCAFMDQDVQLQSITRTTQETINLEYFAKDLRYRIALLDSTQGKHLYYSDRDIRAFLGGIAMSKLHILQGISGTGKTSLPIAFARSLGRAGRKNFKVIEVQAGWRDRQDLIGYFNSFEGRFYETEFLTALYEAQCPEFKDQIYIIILDEMNLSRPEQYFADFLSKLEQDDPLLTLNTDLKRPSPTLFHERNTLAIPPNVWFVGTANQDETTLEFADKTYDRAHVMELERNHPNFTLDYTPSPRHPISYKTLKTAFEDAQKNHAEAANRAFQFFKNDLEKLLGERFKVSWGNRLQRQMNHFIPVVLAAGGSLTEATDHILATKILRKIRDRHDIQAGDLRELQETIETYWSDLDSGKLEKSLAIIQEELRQHERGIY